MLNWHQSSSTCFPNTGTDAFHWRSCLKQKVFWGLSGKQHHSDNSLSVRWLLLFCILIGGHGCFIVGICVRSLWWWFREKWCDGALRHDATTFWWTQENATIPLFVTVHYYMAVVTFGKIVLSDWLLCGPESSYLGHEQRSVRNVMDRQI